MLSQIPVNLTKMKKEDVDKEILRVGVIAELDAINPFFLKCLLIVLIAIFVLASLL